MALARTTKSPVLSGPVLGSLPNSTGTLYSSLAGDGLRTGRTAGEHRPGHRSPALDRYGSRCVRRWRRARCSSTRSNPVLQHVGNWARVWFSIDFRLPGKNLLKRLTILFRTGWPRLVCATAVRSRPS